MALIREQDLAELGDLQVHAQSAEAVTWQGRRSLRLENGPVFVPGLQVENGTVEVSIGAEGAAYPGVAFRVADVSDYELAYGPPHNSERWDAIQYDPIFHRSNTWQAYHGPCYQRKAIIPIGEWFQLSVSYLGDRAAISIDGQPPLVVEQLAHPVCSGLIGIWSYLPAYFCDLRVSTCESLDVGTGAVPAAPNGAVRDWFVEDFGVVRAEPSGVVNLNRFLSASMGEAHLVRRFHLADETELELRFGFSDGLTLDLDGREVFSGENTYQNTDDPAEQGYIDLGDHAITQVLEAGTHILTAMVRVSEPFGWGLALAVQGTGVSWLPAMLG